MLKKARLRSLAGKTMYQGEILDEHGLDMSVEGGWVVIWMGKVKVI